MRNALLLMTLCITPVYSHAQGAPGQQNQVSAELSGIVVDQDGNAVAGATVVLKGVDRSTRVLSDVSGNFRVYGIAPGSYTAVADQTGHGSGKTNVILSGEAVSKVRIVLDATGGIPATPAETAMDFSDKANFSVAGVTDWTAVGGHGSDATLRTSEDLNRETLALKAKSAAASSQAGKAKDRGEDRLRAAQAARPQSYDANHALGMYYLKAEDYSEAIPLLQTASELHRSGPNDLYQLALAYQGKGDFARAKELVSQALLQKDSANFHRTLGELDEQLGDPLAAVRQEAISVEMEPSEQNYFTWGSELLLHRAIWQAAEVFASGATSHPASARIKTAWGAALYAEARYDEAAERLCEASDLDPSSRDPYLFMGRAQLASPVPLPCVREKLERFLRQSPGDPEAIYYVAMVLLRTSDLPEPRRAKELLKKVLTIDPRFADADLQLGILAFAEKRYPEAIAYYEAAGVADPKSGEAHYRLGVAYDRMGDAAHAQKEFKLHDEIDAANAAATEQQRRQIKQFLVIVKEPEKGISTP